MIVTAGRETAGSGAPGCGSATEAVEELERLGDTASVRVAGGVWVTTVDGGGDVGFVTTLGARGRFAPAREWGRLGSGEACGSFCTEPETV